MKKTVPLNAVLIPDAAERVFEGVIFDVYQWPQTMFDGSVATFEMLRRPDTVQTLVLRGSQILLVKDEQPNMTSRLHPPGGRVDPGESWLDAAQRELREETGVVCDTWKLIDVRQPQVKIEWFGALYLAVDIAATGDTDYDAGGEKISLQWVEFDALRADFLNGNNVTMQYLAPFFSRVTSLEQLAKMPEYIGKEIER